MKHFDWKKWIPNVVILVVFIIAAAIYFLPALQGKVIYASDNVSGLAACHEGNEWKQDHPEGSWWCGSVFSGMPNYQMGGHGQFTVDKILQPFRWFLSWGNRNAFFIFLFYLCAFFLLLRSFKVDKWLSMAGAFAIALSSYFFVIIAAQHHGKCYSITWMMLVIVGFILTYRKQYGWGALLIMFFTYIGFFLHPQMSYYICMMIGIFWFAELAIAVKAKEWKHFMIATAVFGASFAIGMGMGSANIFANKEYAEQTMRGGHSDLVKANDETNKTDGLDLDYATAWSEGIEECWTFLVPNYMGGATGYDLGDDSQLGKDLRTMGVSNDWINNVCHGAPTYWGDKSFTSGPVYMGAIVIFLFLLGMLIVSGPYKWALLVATLFSVMLSWGRHFMPLTELFFNYFPMYNKFRAVESILIVAEITIPLLGFLALKAINDGVLNWKKVRNSILIAGGVTGLTCLLMAMMSSSIDVTTTYDDQWKGQVGDQIYQAILDQRQAMISADAWRSLLFVLLGAGLVYLYALKRYKTNDEVAVSKLTRWVGIVLTVLIVADMWAVDKRFCNDDNFVKAQDRDKAFTMLPYEKQLLESDTSYYRVLNLTVNTFNDARTSYYLKSVGGYSAAKLRRYQDLIDEHICKMHMPVLNMLNAKYIITQSQNGQPFPYYNEGALGNAWLVDELIGVDNANDESDALNTINLKHQAVYDKTYTANTKLQNDYTDSIKENEVILFDGNYAPNKFCYHSETEKTHIAVFSEIYYPYGWKCTIDGAPTDIYRVNYMLRAIILPEGQHEIIFSFEPESVKKGNMLAMICFGLFVAVLLGVVGYTIYKKKKSA